mgnify:CR=1 FL=1
MITRAGAIPAVVHLLRSAPAAVQDTAAGILGNLVIQNPANQRAVVAAGALEPLVALLLKGAAAAKEQACFALWNLACQNGANQLAIAEAGAVKPLVALLQRGAASLQEEAAGALMNLALESAESQEAIVGADALPPLVAVLSSGNPSAQAHAPHLPTRQQIPSRHFERAGAPCSRASPSTRGALTWSSSRTPSTWPICTSSPRRALLALAPRGTRQLGRLGRLALVASRAARPAALGRPGCFMLAPPVAAWAGLLTQTHLA